MNRLIASASLAVVLAAANPGGAAAAEVKPNEVAAALGGSWDRETAGRSQLAETGNLIPTSCSPGRFTSANRGRSVYYYGSGLADTHAGRIQTYSRTPAAEPHGAVLTDCESGLSSVLAQHKVVEVVTEAPFTWLR